ncbi:MAG: hypothetical protein QOF73_5418 [Thermomicrobiales bacterium]|nr:hypothetical protein [Thermomicrobiales bacterium]
MKSAKRAPGTPRRWFRRVGGPPRLIALLIVAATLAAPLSQVTASNGGATAAEANPREMFAQTLIEARLRTGEIDYPTSLLYRAYALFGDPRLPADLAGSGSAGEDSRLFREIPRQWNYLPKETQDLLTPFVARPTDPSSRFFRPGGTSADAGAVAESAANAALADEECQDGWISRNGPQHPYKLWMHCTGDYDGDFETAIEIIDYFWEREVELMGEPIPDLGTPNEGGDDRIDFYFVDDEADRAPRRGGIGIPESAAAFAAAEEPVVGKGSSAFVVARRPSIGDPRLSLTLAHEFFHVLQYAHNWEIGFGFQGTPYSADFDILSLVELWFVEATADWMKSYIYRDSMSPEVMEAYLHSRFTQAFQGVDLSLTFSASQDDPRISHIYAAYVYFLFMEQELGAQAVADFWKALADVEPDDFDRTTEILDEMLPFNEHFREFAVRNLNLDLQPGDPISPSYQDVDPTFPTIGPDLNFARGRNGRLPLQSFGEDPQAFDAAILSLTAHYYYFTPAADSTQVTLDFSGLEPNDAIDVDIIAKIADGDWERRQLTTDGPVTFCREVPEDNVEKFYLVISNHDLSSVMTVGGSFTAGAYDGACG